MNFKTRLKEEMEYSDIQHKELAERAGIKQRALLTYVAATPSMPPADVAVRLAKVLGVTVEYLVTGEKSDSVCPAREKKLIENFEKLPEKEKTAVEQLINSLANQ